MIISGGSGTNLVEVIAPFGNVSCSLPNLPTDEGRFSHTHDSSLVCGGTYQDDLYVDALYVYQTCINLTSSGWVKTSHMLKYPRNRHSSWAVEDGVILIGGHDKRRQLSGAVVHWARNTTELVKFDGTTMEAFPLKQWTL